MFETLENDPSLAAGGPDSQSPFGGPMLVPVPNRELASGLDSELAEFDPVREAMESTIATLQQALRQKEHAIVQSTIAATGLQQQLEKSKTQNEQLKKKLAVVAKSHEALSQKVAATEQGA